jgi:CRP-like cAMP-binding protein
MARSDVTTLHLPLRAIKELTNADPTIWRSVALNALLSFDLALRALHDAKLPDAPAKVSAILLRLAGHQNPESASRKIEITQTELADIAGLSRNVINRALRDLSKKGLVSVGYRFIEVSDPESLSKRLAFAAGSKRSIW